MTRPRDIPTSYEDIANTTVPELDVFRATKSTTPVTGRELENRVRAAFEADPRLAQTRIELVVRGSEVWLSGVVIGPGLAAYARDVVRHVDGVTGIHDEMAVLPGF